jgi:hypothetical protein
MQLSKQDLKNNPIRSLIRLRQYRVEQENDLIKLGSAQLKGKEKARKGDFISSTYRYRKTSFFLPGQSHCPVFSLNSRIKQAISIHQSNSLSPWAIAVHSLIMFFATDLKNKAIFLSCDVVSNVTI